MPNHHADLAGAPERHHDERANRGFEALPEEEIEGLVEGHIESDARDSHQGKMGPKRG
jgi:hypothetical protein